MNKITIKETYLALAEALPNDAERGKFWQTLIRYALFAEDPPLDFTGKGFYFFNMIKREIDTSNARRAAQLASVEKRLQNRLQKPLQTPLQKPLQNPHEIADHAEKNPFDEPVSPQNKLQKPLQTPLQKPLQKCLQTSEKEKEKKTPPIPPRKENQRETLPPAPACAMSAPTFFSWIPEKLKTPEFIAKWGEWEKYRSQKRKPISSYAASRQLAALERAGVAAAITAIDEAIRNDYQGLFPKSTTQKQERDYSGC